MFEIFESKSDAQTADEIINRLMYLVEKERIKDSKEHEYRFEIGIHWLNILSARLTNIPWEKETKGTINGIEITPCFDDPMLIKVWKNVSEG